MPKGPLAAEEEEVELRPPFLARLRKYLPVFALVFCGCFITFLAALYVKQTNQRVDEARLRHHATQFEQLLASRMEAYSNSMIHTKAVISAMQRVDLGGLHRYLDEVPILDKYPGILGIGYLEHVKVADIPAFEARMRKKYPNFRVWPRDASRNEYFPIAHYEPQSPENLKVMGFDAGHWPNRRVVQEQAIASGLPMATGKIVLVRDMPSSQTPGWVFFSPIYKIGAPTSAPQERRAAIIGMFNATFRATTFFDALLQQNPVGAEIVFDVYDGTEVNKDALLYSLYPNQDRGTGFRNQGTITVGGRPWTIDFHSLPTFGSFWSRNGHWLVMITGLVFTSLISWLLYSALEKRDTERRLVEQVRRALDARDEFISIASHELRTPITSLKLQLDMAARYGQADPAKTLRKVTMVGKQQVERLTSLVSELLDVTRIQSGKMTFKRECMDLSQLVRELVEHYRNSLSGTEHVLQLQASNEPVLSEVDPLRLGQAVENLLSNAIKYGNSKPIELTVEKTSTHGIIRIRDYGQGIPKDKHNLIFRRFERLTNNENVTGLGLGLYITKQIVDAHQGVIHVQSELGAGSTFTIELPLHKHTPSALPA